MTRKRKRKVYRKEVIRHRRKQVLNLYWVEFHTIHEIAKEINWSPETVYRDIEWIRNEFKDKITAVDVREVWLQVIETRKQTISQLRNELDILGDEKKYAFIRSKITEQIMGHIRDNIKDLQELGFIEKPKERIEVETTDYEFRIIKGKEKSNKDKLESDSEAG